MGFVLFDASGLSKRYSEEQGAETLEAIFAERANHTFVATSWGYLETFAVLVRRKNGGILTQGDFNKANSLLQKEFVDDAYYNLLQIDEPTVFAATDIVQRHNLNATDAALLSTFLTFAQAVGVASCLLIASDKRLIRSALAEGLVVLNPEEILPAAVSALLASLP